MGGHISVGVRRKDGGFRTIGVWTNPLCHFMREKEFRLDGSLEPLDRFFARYLKDGTDFGGPQDTVPGEYGYVLVDEMTMTITTMNSYSSPEWVTQDDVGFVPHGRVWTTQERMDEMAEMREAVIEARYVLRGARKHTYEPLPPFTTHEAFFKIVEEISFRGSEPVAPRDYRHRNYLGFRVGFPAWKIENLFPDTLENFIRMRATVEAVVALTDEERAEWQAELDHRLERERANSDDIDNGKESD